MSRSPRAHVGGAPLRTAQRARSRWKCPFDDQDHQAYLCRLRFLHLLYQGDRHGLGRLLLTRTLDFGALDDFLTRERMGVYVHARMAELGLDALLPATLRGKLEAQYEDQQARTARLLGLIGELGRVFSTTGIDLMVLKGLPFAERYWGGIERRFCWDLDLLVREADLSAATRLLTRLGFAGRSLIPGAEYLARRVIHAVELTRHQVALDLHWTFRNRPGIRIDEAALWAGRRRVQLAGIECWAPSDDYQLLQLLLGLIFDLERSHLRLRNLWDLRLMLQALSDWDWDAFLTRREAEGLGRLTAAALALVVQGLDCRDELPALAQTLDRQAGSLPVFSPSDVRALLGRPRQSFANRHLVARLQPLPAWIYWFWWTSTLPARYLLGRNM